MSAFGILINARTNILYQICSNYDTWLWTKATEDGVADVADIVRAEVGVAAREVSSNSKVVVIVVTVV